MQSLPLVNILKDTYCTDEPIRLTSLPQKILSDHNKQFKIKI